MEKEAGGLVPLIRGEIPSFLDPSVPHPLPCEQGPDFHVAQGSGVIYV